MGAGVVSRKVEGTMGSELMKLGSDGLCRVVREGLGSGDSPRGEPCRVS